ncbi:MAG TPA: hypothetical protein VFP40_15620 [Terriglobales bacterium]|jgi:hypothetical protein|nr:hypothetical protein [Terriglobales bacterium]
MQKLKEVEEAKQIMTEAVNWSVMKWLSQKKRVRRAADVANAALNNLERVVKANWSDELRSAYQQVSGTKSKLVVAEAAVDLAKKIKRADDEALKAHDQAEATFDDADRQLSTTLARRGCGEAIRSWELHEKAIALAETGVRSAKSSA